jgi:hypothetical protein
MSHIGEPTGNLAELHRNVLVIAIELRGVKWPLLPAFPDRLFGLA